ncbi:MAG TPA: LacI family DNA-binding transcriptional regulator [Actinoplanes sp.]|nr:LacI family DNA-binding transcriptional regulator [Actinoplanes sp.]
MTSADVARAAGLSRATVSYVLNDTPHQKIPEETRRRVLAAAARLEYAPSAAARALRSGRSDVVLCLLPDWPVGPEVGALLGHLSTELARRGWTLAVHPTTGGDRPIAQLWRAITPAAVLAFEELSDDDISAMRAAGVAVVVALLGRSSRRPRELEVPQQRVGRLQAQHLAATGHSRLGYAYPDDPRLAGFARPRLEGVAAACTELGLDPPAVQTVPLEADAAAVAIQLWRGNTPAVTGVCAYNDDVALAVLAGLRLLGLEAPTDLAVVGVDDIAAARLAAPPLTTVTTDQSAVARQLTDTIIAAIADESPPSRPGAEVARLVRRAST